MAELVIIGNGFDLTCDLKSSYSDYFKYRYTDEMKQKLYNYEDLPDEELNELNFWDFIFGYVDIFQIYEQYYLKGTWQGDKNIDCLKDDEILRKNLSFYESVTISKNWQDVENVLQKYFILINDSKIHLIFINNVSDFYQQKRALDFPDGSNDLEKHLSSILLKVFTAKMKIRNKSLPSFVKEDGDEGYKRCLIQILKSELNDFEYNFKSYLLAEVAENKYYAKKANNFMFNQILKNVDIDKEKIRILNFNYTSPFGNGPIIIQNIHGSLYGNGVIFGIDNQKVFSKDAKNNRNKLLRIFTKTYRILGSFSEPFNIYFGKDMKIKNDEINVIKFYGHSLGEADYSYFQSIFDGVNLYGSDVVLKFLYSEYDGKEKERQFDRISSLLSDYGTTLNNKDHGKNLMHKLLLENRLLINEVQ